MKHKERETVTQQKELVTRTQIIEARFEKNMKPPQGPELGSIACKA